MLSSDKLISENGFSLLQSDDLWRSLPTCYPTKDLFWPKVLSKKEQRLAEALTAQTSGIDHAAPQQERWVQYGENESTEFCFHAVDIPPTRFSDGNHPVWYGADSQEASKAEVAYHAVTQARHELKFSKEKKPIIFEKALYQARVELRQSLDVRKESTQGHKGLLENGPPYPFCSELAAKILELGGDGICSLSRRCRGAEICAVFKQDRIKTSKVKAFWVIKVTEAEVFICNELVKFVVDDGWVTLDGPKE